MATKAITTDGDLVFVKSVSGLGETIFSQTVTDSIIDWANKIDITVPSWATKVELTIEGKSGQTGADNTLRMRLNSDETSTYLLHTLNIDTTAVVGATPTTGDNVAVFNTINGSNQTGKTTISGCVKARGTNYKYVDIDRKFFSASAHRMRLGKVEWQNTADDITSIQIYATASTNVSCVITARAWA